MISRTAALVAPAMPYLGLAAGAHADSTRIETPVVSSSPITSVAESVVSVRIPLPASAGPHPAACDRLSYLRWRTTGSFGFFRGPGVKDENYPVPNSLTGSLSFLSNLFGGDRKAVPTETGPLYTWLTKDEIDASAGPYTPRAQEVTDVAELARSFVDAPLDFTEWYFPNYHHLDVLTASPPQYGGRPEIVSSELVRFVG